MSYAWELPDLAESLPNEMNNFYLGTGAEYLLMASLSRRGYDVMKPPVDYGFDVVAMENAAKSGPEGPRNWFFQVKSINVAEKDKKSMEVRGEAHPAVFKSIYVSGYTLNLLQKYDNSCIVVYLYDESIPVGMEKEDGPVTYFWMNREDVFHPYSVGHIRQVGQTGDKPGKGKGDDSEADQVGSQGENRDWNSRRSGGYYEIPLQIVYPVNGQQGILASIGVEPDKDTRPNWHFLGTSARGAQEKSQEHFRLSSFLR